MNDINTWLATLGLGQYANAFTENDIDGSVVLELNHELLREIGVKSVGHRVTILKAIAALATEKQNTAQRLNKEPIQSTTGSSQAERRQLTVMFVDMAGSTALSGRLDPEDLSVIMRRYQNTVSGEINRLEGYVAKFMGDGVLAYFGWPRAHEDEAERAVRAGLAIIHEVAKIQAPDNESLAARIGIATGQVVVGDIIGEGSAQEETVVGETPNIAARLEALAKPGEIMIADSTRQLCGEAFAFEPLGAQTLKGVAEAVDVYRVGQERALESRFQAQHAGAVLPLIGREAELVQIMMRWRQASNGEGQMVLLSGEAGIGKSRIMYAVSDALEQEEYYRISYQCSPYHSDSALYPVIQQLMRAAGFSAEDSNENKLDKLEQLLGLTLSAPRAHAPLMAALLNIDGDARYGKLEFSPQQQRTQTLQALIEQLKALAQQQPVLFIIEDAHWIDPTTLELVERALDTVGRSRILLLMTARPTFEHHFGGHPIVLRVTLNQLGRKASHSIIESLSGGKALPAELIDEIIRKTDGVPLFVEQLTKTVLESGQLRETESAYVLDGPLSSIDVPSSLHDSLMARLDRLQPIREVAQTAACIGREFSYQLLSAVMALQDENLQLALAQLTDAELVFRRGAPPNAEYVFKHALVRDTAYASLLRGHRQSLHERVADTLESRFPEVAAAEPDVLAYHYAQAGRMKEAVAYTLRASAVAIAHANYREAIAQLEGGLEITKSLPEENERATLELDLMVALSWAVRIGRTPVHQRCRTVLERAYALCKKVGGPVHLSPVLFGLSYMHLWGGNLHEALDGAKQLMALTEQDTSRSTRIIAEGVLAQTYWHLGRNIEAKSHYDRLDEIYDARIDTRQQYAFSVFHMRAQAAEMRFSLGLPDQAREYAETALTLARVTKDNVMIGMAYFHLIHVYVWRGDAERVIELADELSAMQKNPDFRIQVFDEASRLCKLWALASCGKLFGAANQMVAALEDWHAFDFGVWTPAYAAMIAEILIAEERPEQALQLTDENLKLIAETGERQFESLFFGLRGDALLAIDSAGSVDADACYQQAVDIARSQSAKSWELRAATSLARLWQQQEKNHEARELLAPIYDWFTEGFDTADLQDAKALLEELTCLVQRG